MAFDYSDLAATATTLIADFGRDVTLRLQPQQPADSAKPWDDAQAPAVATDDVTLDGVKAAFLDPAEEDRQGQTVEVVRARVLVAATSLIEEVPGAGCPDDTTQVTHDLDQRWQVVDGARAYEILRAVPVKPGGTLLYYDLLVEL